MAGSPGWPGKTGHEHTGMPRDVPPAARSESASCAEAGAYSSFFPARIIRFMSSVGIGKTIVDDLSPAMLVSVCR